MSNSAFPKWLVVLMVLFQTITVVAQGKFKFESFNAADGLADNSAQTISCTKTGRLVITTMGQINFFDGQIFSYIDPSDENVYPLVDYRGNYHLYFDRYNHIWLKNTHNVTCVDLVTERFVNSVDEEFKAFGMADKVRDLFVDCEGVVWLLTTNGLFNVNSKRTYTIDKSHNLQEMDTYQEKYLLLFFENGKLEVIELDTGETVYSSNAYGREEAYKYRSSSLVIHEGPTFFQIRNGQKEGRLMSFDIGKWEWTTILSTPYHLNNMTVNDSLLYVPCEYGYWTYDMRNGDMVHTDSVTLARGGKLATDINVISFDLQGGMWLGTEKRGVLYSRPYPSPFMVYGWDKPEAVAYSVLMDRLPQQTRYRGRNVNCVYRDSRKWTWVGTPQGLQVYRKNSDHLPEVFTKGNGLYNNVIHSIVEDHMHNIWVGTSYGISCLQFDKDGKVRNVTSYNQYDYIPNESFINGRALCLEDGTIVMQALDHVIAFNPQKMSTLQENYPFKISPRLVKVLVNGNDMKTGMELDGNVILPKAISQTNEIDLNYDQNSITLTFSGMNYFRPQQTFYRVRVKGLNDHWHVFTSYNSQGMVDRRGLLHLPLTGLRPGTYIVEVQSSLKPDQWDAEAHEWIINVNQPWWRTTGVVMLFFFVLLALLGVNIYYYLRNANMRALRNSEELGLLKRLRSFAERCSEGGEILEPVPEEMIGNHMGDDNGALSPEFVRAMTLLMPLLQTKKPDQLSMRDLSATVGMDLQSFYSLITSNIYKSPHALVKMIMLNRAAEMLDTTPHTVEEIAEACGFVSPNYFIGSFFHQMKMTPTEYRKR